MDIQTLISEEIAEYIRKLDDQKRKVADSVESFEREDDDEEKLKKGLRSESEKQKLYSLQAKFLKEKVDASKKKQDQIRAKLDVIRKSRM